MGLSQTLTIEGTGAYSSECRCLLEKYLTTLCGLGNIARTWHVHVRSSHLLLGCRDRKWLRLQTNAFMTHCIILGKWLILPQCVAVYTSSKATDSFIKRCQEKIPEVVLIYVSCVLKDKEPLIGTAAQLTTLWSGQVKSCFAKSVYQ